MPVERPKIKPLRQTTLFGHLTKSKTTVPDEAAQAVVPSTSPTVAPKSALRTPPKKSAPSKSKSKNENRSLTDVILCIKPEFVTLIAAREKNHEYRKYKLKESVTRLWLYETAPTSAITYVMSTTRPKVPGEVNDPSSIGNDDFDNGLKQSKYGYPVTALWKFKTPLTTADLKTRFEIPVPQGWRYATKRLVEEEPLDGMEKVF